MQPSETRELLEKIDAIDAGEWLDGTISAVTGFQRAPYSTELINALYLFDLFPSINLQRTIQDGSRHYICRVDYNDLARAGTLVTVLGMGPTIPLAICRCVGKALLRGNPGPNN